MTRIIACMRDWLQREDGTASVEFVLAVPPMFALFIMSFESGMLMIRNIMLERGVDIVMRELRLNHYEAPTHDLIKEEICNNVLMFANCEESILVNLQPVDMTTWDMPTGPIPCIDRSADVKPAPFYSNSTDPHQVMLVRACVAVDALFPTTGIGLRLPKDGDGGYWLTAVSAFVNEPTI